MMVMMMMMMMMMMIMMIMMIMMTTMLLPRLKTPPLTPPPFPLPVTVVSPRPQVTAGPMSNLVGDLLGRRRSVPAPAPAPAQPKPKDLNSSGPMA
jgi:hypothetical protein